MVITENTLPIQLDRDFFDSEIDRLIHSAKNRIEQQRIHLKELRGNAAEIRGARHELKAMIEGCEKLQVVRRQLSH
jgi:predicted transcriptional regulator